MLINVTTLNTPPNERFVLHRYFATGSFTNDLRKSKHPNICLMIKMYIFTCLEGSGGNVSDRNVRNCVKSLFLA